MSSRSEGGRTAFTVVTALGVAVLATLTFMSLAPASESHAAPASIACPSGETITVSAPGASAPTTVTATVAPPVNLKAAKDGVVDSFHLHYFVDIDPSTIVQAGQPVPAGNPKIIHSAATTQDVGPLSTGQHTVWVVLGDVGHTTCTPMVVGSVSFDVKAAASLPASGAGAVSKSPNGSMAPLLIAIFLAGLAAASGGLVLRRD